MKLVSWNVNGIRAILKKGFTDDVKKLNADVLCLQETKINEEIDIGVDYPFRYWNYADKKGYSGTAIFSKVEPLSVSYDSEGHKGEGRVIVAEFAEFVLINVYTPNSQRGLTRLEYRQKWDKDFLAFMKNQSKPVIVCGDLNVAHQEIDLANPKTNKKNAGFTDEERAGMTAYIDNGYIDTFRHFYPQEVKYSWWSYMFQARAKNIGWRIDYFLVDERLKDSIRDAHILNEVMGSDHCPVTLELENE